MQYNYNDIFSLLKSKSLAKSELMGQGDLTPAYLDVMMAIAKGLKTSFNIFMSTAIINNVLVSGGTCSPQGSLSDANGTGSQGCIIGSISNTHDYITSFIPAGNIVSITDGLKAFTDGVGKGVQIKLNEYFSQASINNIIVSGGTCTCLLSPPTPGTLISASGRLSQLKGNIQSAITAQGIRIIILNNLGSEVTVRNGQPTDALSASIDAISEAVYEYHNMWLTDTQLTGLNVSGGLTIANGPVSGALGNGGKFQ